MAMYMGEVPEYLQEKEADGATWEGCSLQALVHGGPLPPCIRTPLRSPPFDSRGKELVSGAWPQSGILRCACRARLSEAEEASPDTARGAPSKLCRLPDPHFMMLMKSEKEEAKEEMCSCHSFLLFAKVARPIRCGQ